MQLIIGIFLVILIGVFIFRHRFFSLGEKKTKNYLALLLFLFLLAGAAANTLIYTYYYSNRATSDIYKYFDDSKFVYEIVKQNPGNIIWLWQDEAPLNEKLNSLYTSTQNWSFQKKAFWDTGHRGIILFHAMLRIISGGFLPIHVLVFAFMAFIGMVFTLKSFLLFENEKSLIKNRKYWIVFLLPSVFIWIPAMLNEALAIACMGAIIYSLLQISQREKISRAFSVAAVSFFFLYFFKAHICLLLLASSIVYLFVHFLKIKKAYIVFGSVLCLVLSSDYIFYNYKPSLSISKHLEKKLAGSLVVEAQYPSNSLIPGLDKTNRKYSAQLVGFFTACFRPFPWEANSLFTFIASLENIFLVLLLLWGLIKRQKQEVASSNFLCFIFFVIIFHYWFSGATLTNFGTLIRFRAMTIPLLVPALLLLQAKKDKSLMQST